MRRSGRRPRGDRAWLDDSLLGSVLGKIVDPLGGEVLEEVPAWAISGLGCSEVGGRPRRIEH